MIESIILNGPLLLAMTMVVEISKSRYSDRLFRIVLRIADGTLPVQAPRLYWDPMNGFTATRIYPSLLYMVSCPALDPYSG